LRFACYRMSSKEGSLCNIRGGFPWEKSRDTCSRIRRRFPVCVSRLVWIGDQSSRLFISPYVGAVRGVLKEKARIDAEIDAYIAREFNDGSGGVKR
jgi:hypothetical protein